MPNEPITSVFNDGYIADLFEAYKRDPASVGESWRQFFSFAQSLAPAAAAGAPVPSTSADSAFLRNVSAAAKLCDAIRTYGHLAVALDPLGTPAPGTIELTPEFHALTEADLERIPGSALAEHVEGATAAEIVRQLRSFYSSN